MKMYYNKKTVLLITCIFIIICLMSSTDSVQNNKYNNNFFNGHILFTPQLSTKTYLLNNNNEIIQTWHSNYKPKLSVYMLENGNILRTIELSNPPVFGNMGIEEITWDGTVIWHYELLVDNMLGHHDIEPLPNGNVLMIGWGEKSIEEVIQAGRNPDLLIGEMLRPDFVLEIKPTGPTSGDIVWEWHIWDHLIQDYDSSKDNYGIVGDHPELIDINYVNNNIDFNWIHSNSVDYNEEFDQILLSSRNFNEIWVIDHSTTTAEAAGHTGGNSGKGGDILYRWGNPEAYRAGITNDQKFFAQHDAQWIETGCPGEGNILVFNNGVGRPGSDYSTVDEIVPPVDSNGNYYLETGSAYGPDDVIWSYIDDNPTDFYSEHIAGAQRLPSGNTLICNGWNGIFFEVTPNSEIVWEYINLLPNINQNAVFKIRHYYLPFSPDLDCLNDIYWNNIDPGSTIYGSFMIRNIGGPGSHLDWQIESFPDWGTWTFDNTSGEDLTPEEGSVVINVEVISPDVEDQEFTGKIKVINQENTSDYDIIDVYLNSELISDLDCSEEYIWTDIIPNSITYGNIKVKNIGDQESQLNWKINNYPSWGNNWTFTPNQGVNLTPEQGELNITITCKAPNNYDETYTGNIEIINLDNNEDIEYVNVTLNTLKDTTGYPHFNWEIIFGTNYGTEHLQDIGNSIIETNDGGYILTGGVEYEEFSSIYNGDITIIKIDEFGEIVWNKTIGTEFYDIGMDIIETEDLGYLIAAYTTDGINDLCWLIKTDNNGETIWDTKFNGGYPSLNYRYKICETNDDGYIVSTGISIVKTDNNGYIIWTIDSDQTNDLFYYFYDIIETDDQNYISVGKQYYFGDIYWDALILKIDKQGNIIWSNNFGGNNYEEALSIDETSDGYIICGWTDSYGNGNNDAWLVKTNNIGIELWNKTYGGADKDYARTVCLTKENEYLITGSLSNNETWTDILFMKTDSLGNIKWDITYDNNNAEDQGINVIQTSDGGYLLTGGGNSSRSIYGNWYTDLISMKYTSEYAPSKPTIIGPSSGKTNTEYEYTISAIDPENQDIYYYIDWGDITNSGWIGPYNSGENIIVKHTWSKQGDYDIRIKAKDDFDYESSWSDPLLVNMPKNYLINLIDLIIDLFNNHPMFFQFLKNFI